MLHVQLTSDQIKRKDGTCRNEEAGDEGRTILRTRGGMEIYRNPKSVLPRPLEGTEDVLPARARQEGLPFPHVDSPPGDRQSNPIQPSARYFCEVLLGLGGKRGEPI
jgi:hypothetical protein